MLVGDAKSLEEKKYAAERLTAIGLAQAGTRNAALIRRQKAQIRDLTDQLRIAQLPAADRVEYLRRKLESMEKRNEQT